MTSWKKCDNCGKLQQEPRLLHGEDRERAYEARKDQVLISLEHDDDMQCFDACSWACVAELAMKQAAENAIGEETS